MVSAVAKATTAAPREVAILASALRTSVRDERETAASSSAVRATARRSTPALRAAQSPPGDFHSRTRARVFGSSPPTVVRGPTVFRSFLGRRSATSNASSGKANDQRSGASGSVTAHLSRTARPIGQHPTRRHGCSSDSCEWHPVLTEPRTETRALHHRCSYLPPNTPRGYRFGAHGRVNRPGFGRGSVWCQPAVVAGWC